MRNPGKVSAQEVLVNHLDGFGDPTSDALKLASIVQACGFGWESSGQIRDQLIEEAIELSEARKADDIEEALGDVLFLAIALAGFIGITPDKAISAGNQKFARRMASTSDIISSMGQDLSAPDKWRVLWKASRRWVEEGAPGVDALAREWPAGATLADALEEALKRPSRYVRARWLKTTEREGP